VRELENAIERAVILCDGPEITQPLLAIQGAGGLASLSPSGDSAPSLEDYFRRFVVEHQAHLSETEIARRLGMSRKALWERRQRMGIPRRNTGA
jgi:DNA-binding NtrC family response regulator